MHQLERETRGMGNRVLLQYKDFGPWLLITLLSSSGPSVGSCILRSQNQFIISSICYRITWAVFQQKFCWFMLQELLTGKGWEMPILVSALRCDLWQSPELLTDCLGLRCSRKIGSRFQQKQDPMLVGDIGFDNKARDSPLFGMCHGT